MKNGFLKTACISPRLRVADCEYNRERIVETISFAAEKGVKLLVLPELCITGYTCGDLFLQQPLLSEAKRSLEIIAKSTENLDILVCAGLPLEVSGRLYNAAAVISRGAVRGVVPKSYLPTYSEFYEERYFAPPDPEVSSVELFGQNVPFGTKLLFVCRELPELVLALEICEDLFVSVSPSARHSLAGATVVANLSASDEAVCKPAFRRELVKLQSNKNTGAYLYCSAGPDESTGDVVFSAHNIVAENGVIVAESEPFGGGTLITELDLGRIAYERRHLTSVRAPRESGYREIPVSLDVVETELTRSFSPLPFIPSDERERDSRCREILAIQCNGLKKRLEHTGGSSPVVGVSGGLDSTLALLVCCRTMELCERPSSDVVGISMPCFGTTSRTKSNAERLCELLGATCKVIDIKRTVGCHLDDIGHSGETDTAFENAQARERTQVLMDVANMSNGLVIGTGDLSEQALGWCTYNGDHMSMYAVNCSVPKTLVRHLVKYIADTSTDGELKRVLYDILDTPVSPELLPAEGGEISQRTEELVGPYELHDFFLYYVIRWGFSPRKVFALACRAFGDRYDRATILKWLRVFVRRFFSSQFKRSCVPDGPKVGSVALSPRGDWRMPSDVSSALWLAEIDSLEP